MHLLAYTPEPAQYGTPKILDLIKVLAYRDALIRAMDWLKEMHISGLDREDHLSRPSSSTAARCAL